MWTHVCSIFLYWVGRGKRERGRRGPRGRGGQRGGGEAGGRGGKLEAGFPPPPFGSLDFIVLSTSSETSHYLLTVSAFVAFSFV